MRGPPGGGGREWLSRGSRLRRTSFILGLTLVDVAKRPEGRRYTLSAVPDGKMARGRPPSSSGLGHRPFKAEARVRIPLGARHHHICARRGVRSSSPPCQGGDRGIEARRARWASESETARSPVGEVAQLVEHAAENRGVGGPIPPLPTRENVGEVAASDLPNDGLISPAGRSGSAATSQPSSPGSLPGRPRS